MNIDKIGKKWFPLVFIVVLIGFVFLFIKSCMKSGQVEEKATQTESRVDTLKKIANKNGDIVNIAQTQTINNQLQDSLEYYKQLASQIASAKAKEIERLTTIVSKLSIRPNAKIDTIYKHDSMPVYVYGYSDKWITYGAIASKDSLVFNPPIQIKDSSDIVFTIHKNRLEARVINYNPYMRIDKVRDIDFRKFTAPKRWGIGPSFGATYYQGSFNPYIGIGLNYNLIRF